MIESNSNGFPRPSVFKTVADPVCVTIQKWNKRQESNLRDSASEANRDAGNPHLYGDPVRSCTLLRSFGDCYLATRTEP